VLHVEDGEVTLEGTPARLFVKGRQPVDILPGSRLDEALPRAKT
jgi:hypothetical protein